MKITFLCSDPAHPVTTYLDAWVSLNDASHDIIIARNRSDLIGGDILFLISCSEVIKKAERANYRACLVLHASDLPQGRGWSPHIWAIINGAETITLSLLEAEDKVDSGRIWRKVIIPIPKDVLWDEINARLFDAEIELINFAVQHIKDVIPTEQSSNIAPTYYPRRTPEDSRVDPSLSIADQFNKIRVCDPHRYPAFFDLHGHRYKLILEKINE